MSKYGELSRRKGHSKWFLQKTLLEHDRSMDHPWMQMIYKQCFSLEQYILWLAQNLAIFEALEQKTQDTTLPHVSDDKLLRSGSLRTDLQQLAGARWREEADSLAHSSPAVQKYLIHLDEDSSDVHLLLAHHFLQYNAVLSGGSYLGKMVAEKLCVVHGTPGVAFYAFNGVKHGQEPARVQRYLREFDEIEITTQQLDSMVAVMRRIYADTEAMMQEAFDLNPSEGIAYSSAKDAAGNEEPLPPCPEQLQLSLTELQGFDGADGGRILFSLAGDLLDVSVGRELYGPGAGYSVLAGHDVTRCLATMSLASEDLDDVAWKPSDEEEEKALAMWRQKLKCKYPVAGQLDKSKASSDEGLRQRSAKSSSSSAPPAATAAATTEDSDQKCPISGKAGICPMTMMGIVKPKAKSAPSAATNATSGFMAGKSLIAAVEESNNSPSEEWWLYRLCPLHWDDQTMKAFLIVAAVSWFSGVLIGWNLHKQVVR